MNHLTGALILGVVFSACASTTSVPELRSDMAAFEQYMVNYNKIYKDLVEKLKRFDIFVENINLINVMNANNSTNINDDDDNDDENNEDTTTEDSSSSEEDETDYKAKYGMGPWTDMSTEEFRKNITNMNMTNYMELRGQMEEWKVGRRLEAPANFDWRKKNKVTPVKNQGSCGSCWCFSVIGNTENAKLIKDNKQTLLSEQQLLDCDNQSQGCNGGWPEKAIQDAINRGGLMGSKDYPYQGQKGGCRFNKSKVQVKISKNVQLPDRKPAKWGQYLAQKSSFITLINADKLQHYKSGILSLSASECPNSERSLNHALITVGYGTQAKKGPKFWILKNSWGTGWGEQGYARVLRGKNTCGMELFAHSVALA